MTEKVKLPKYVCDALDSIQIDVKDKTRIFRDIASGNYSLKYSCFYEQVAGILKTNKVLMNDIMRALVLGYEPELSVLEDDAE